jgi:hypothetical protein
MTKVLIAIAVFPLFLSGCANSIFTTENTYYGENQLHVGTSSTGRKYRVTPLNHINPPTRAVILNDNFYGVSGYSFIRCATVDLVGSDGSGLYSFAQPVCVSSTSSLSELEPYPR